MSAVDIRNLTYTYEAGVTALRDVSIQVDKGEFVAIMGPNGAGKTTLCLHINGIIPHILGGECKGKVTVAGMNVWEHPVYEMSRKVGMVFQNPETQLFCPDLKSEIVFGPENLGVPRDEIRRRLKWALSVVRLEGLEDRAPTDLSGGQKQRAAIAAALSMMPEILVLDEATSQLDPIGTSEVFSVLKDLNKEYGITVIMATHKSELVAEVADKIFVLYKGKLVLSGDPEEVFSKVDLLNKIFVKPPAVSELAYKLSNRNIKLMPIPVTLQKAYEKLSSCVREGKIKPSPITATRKRHSKGDVIIEVKDLWYVYPGPPPIEALKGVNLRIRKGEFVAIVGQNGAGKTTLVKHFIGLLKPTKGRVIVNGKDVSTVSPAELSAEVGFVFQNPDHQLFAYTVQEEVAFGPKNLGLPEDEVNKRVEDALKLVGLWNLRNVYPFKLSFGDRRKLSVAAVIAMKPKVLVLDEPTTGQDYKGRYEITEIAARMREEGCTVIMITHDMELVAKYADRTIVMGLGKILLDGPTDEVLSKEDILEQTYIKPPQITQLANLLSNYGVPNNILTVDEMYEV
ncbi:MAG: ABC transporter, partial [Thermoprotei archaeon]